MKGYDPEREAHKAWIGLLQPTGLVVSPPALSKAGARLDKNVVPAQQRLQDLCEEHADEEGPLLPPFVRFAEELLAWQGADLLGSEGAKPVPEEISVLLPSEREMLRPSFVVVDFKDRTPLLLVQEIPPRTALDKPSEAAGDGWNASPQARLERLLHGTNLAAGILYNRETLRLVYAPRGETSGFLDFPRVAMCSVRDRDVLSAALMLLHERRVFSSPDGQRLLDILRESRKYQNEVSTRLAGQVQVALWELLRGFEAANEQASGRILGRLSQEDPNHIYGGLLTVIMRLVFLLYAEDQGLLPDDPIYTRNYAVGGLYERLRDDAGRYPDTMNQRYGAWACLLSTFRFVFDGGGHKALRLPARHGQLFNPDEFPFLEGRPRGVSRVKGERFEPPRLSDGVLWRVLESLLLLDGERLSYRTLDVEQIGSVYESIMGFEVKSVPGRALAVAPQHIVIDLDEYLRTPSKDRLARLEKEAECKLTGQSATAFKEAKSVEGLVAALGCKVGESTPQPLPPGAMFLQPGEERRRSGSHYTPRELTAPLVEKTLGPVLAGVGENPRAGQVLELKVCDPAMGSGAFLVESCRQLAERVVAAWEAHGETPRDIPHDETALLYARRLVAQRCLYGVDKNPFAVNLARLSLWLVTLAKEHAFTFLDHALKHGDSLVGLGRAQVGAFHWSPSALDSGPLFAGVTSFANEARGWRKQLQERIEGDYDTQRETWQEAEKALEVPRVMGDLCVGAFFGGDKDKRREELRREAWQLVGDWQNGEAKGREAAGEKARTKARGLRGEGVNPFHWELEFSEVFGRQNPGFDAFLGNPPFLGGKRISTVNGDAYRDWLSALHEGSSSNADLSAHFFRRAFAMLRVGGCFGLIATNTIAQGDTRGTGLRWIRQHGGVIYDAERRYKWPGMAAVIVSTVCVQKEPEKEPAARLDGQPVPHISAFLFPKKGDEDPKSLRENENKSFQGSIILGMGFTFDDSNSEATPLAEMQRLIQKDARNGERIFPYLGGEELNTSPTHAHHRYVINFGEMSEDEARQWPDLIHIVEAKVKPERKSKSKEIANFPWWHFWRTRGELFAATRGLSSVLACSRHQHHWSLTFCSAKSVLSEATVVFASERNGFFGMMQSRVHEVWARFFASSMKDDLRYTPSDCFETFPFPRGWEQNEVLEEAGRVYYEYRAALMVRNDEGLTKTYNRFHAPDERSADIEKLRDLHAALDRAVLDAYGWHDLRPACEFLLDYEEEDADSKKKKPYRYRWPNEMRDEVLARLIALNQARHQEERLSGPSPRLVSEPAPARPETSAPEKRALSPKASSPKGESAPKPRGRPKKGSGQGELL